MERALNILNVDDDEVARYVKSRILAQAGHHVIEATCGAEALAHIATGVPEITLLDMKLPDMSGFELTRRIRANPATQALPIVQISAICVTDDDERDGMDSGADAYLTPPVDPSQLIAVILDAYRARLAPALPTGADEVTRRRVRQVDAHIRENLAHRLGVRQLAGIVGLSPFHFTRLFKAATGEAPHGYVTRLRLDEAKRLLRETDLSVSEIARRVGFRTQAHFSAAFRLKTGDSPRSYRTKSRPDA